MEAHRLRCQHPMRTLTHIGLHHTQGLDAHPPPTIAGNGLSSLFLRARVPAPLWGNPCILSARYLMLDDSSRSWMWAVQHRGIYRFSGNGCRKPPGPWLGCLAIRAATCLGLPVLPEQRWEGFFYSLPHHPGFQTYTLPWKPLSTHRPGEHTPEFRTTEAGVTVTYASHPSEKFVIQSWRVYWVRCRLPTAEDATRSWIGCGEIHTFVSHCFS